MSISASIRYENKIIANFSGIPLSFQRDTILFFEKNLKILKNMGFDINTLCFEFNDSQPRTKYRRIHHYNKNLTRYYGMHDGEEQLITEYPIPSSRAVISRLHIHFLDYIENNSFIEKSFYFYIRLTKLTESIVHIEANSDPKEIILKLDQETEENISININVAFSYNLTLLKEIILKEPKYLQYINQNNKLSTAYHFILHDEKNNLFNKLSYSKNDLLFIFNGLFNKIITYTHIEKNILFNFIFSGFFDPIFDNDFILKLKNDNKIMDDIKNTVINKIKINCF